MIGLHPHGGTLWTELNTKWFRNRDLLSLENLPSDYPRARKASWNVFWSSSMPHQALTILWCIYRKRPPCRSRLNRLIPQRFVDNDCLLCGAIKNDEHFLRSSPLKQPAWERFLPRFLPRRFTFNFRTISLPPSTTLKLLPCWSFDLHAFIACRTLILWRFCWKFVFDDIVFWPSKVTARTPLMLRHIGKENGL